MAAAAYDPKTIKATRGTKFMLSAVAGDSQESDLLSYLLFDASYTKAVEDLGYNDAMARETEIIRFLERARR